MKGPKELLAHEDHWNTRMGLVFPGERVVFRGKDLFHELKNMRWMELLLFGITGRQFSENQIRLFEGIWSTCTSYPDPRIWNNRVAALAGTVRSTPVLGISAAIAVSEATIYGFKPIIGAYNFISQVRERASLGKSLESIVIEELKRYRSIPGYARPIVNADERILPLCNLAKELNLGSGENTQLAFKIEEILQNHRYRLKINVAALAAALAADQGLSAHEYYQYLIPCFIGGMIPCFIEARHRYEGIFLPLSCTRIHYEGAPSRKWL